jgi:hypothetical protein
VGEEPTMEGLLHLAVLAIAIAGGYIGLDKLGHEKFRSAFDNIEPGAARELNETRKILMSLDLMEGEVAILHPRYGMFYQYLVCVVTGIPYELAAPYRFAYFFRWQRYVPLLGYFRRRWDVPTVLIMFAWAMLSFCCLVASTIDFGIQKIDNQGMIALFISYVVIIGWVILLVVALKWKLQKIPQTCQTCYGNIKPKMRPPLA